MWSSSAKDERLRAIDVSSGTPGGMGLRWGVAETAVSGSQSNKKLDLSWNVFNIEDMVDQRVTCVALWVSFFH